MMILREVKPTRKERMHEMLSTSAMRLAAYRKDGALNWLLIRIEGSAAKLPSTTNNRMLTVQRSHVIRAVEHMRLNPAARTLQSFLSLAQKVRELRPMMTKAPAHLEQLAVLTSLYESACSGAKYQFELDTDKRALVLMLLSPLLNRHDSHNIPKATLDLLQEIGVLNNDRYVDAMAVRKSDWNLPGASTEIMIECYDSESKARTMDLYSRMSSIIQRLDANEVRAHA